MYSVWAKRLLPAPVSTGTVCLTMYLTNQQRTMLDGLGILALEEKPKVDEPEIKPEEKPEPKPQAETGSGGSGKPDSSDSSDGEQSEESQKSEAQPPATDSQDNSQSSQDPSKEQSSSSPELSSAGVQQEELDVKELIKAGLKEISDKYPSWTKGSTGLVASYEMATRFKTVLGNLKAWQQQSNDAQQS